jgi:hypothetical protein
MKNDHFAKTTAEWRSRLESEREARFGAFVQMMMLLPLPAFVTVKQIAHRHYAPLPIHL